MKPMRLHHVGIVLPTLEKAHQFMQNNGLEIDYAGYVDAYQADLIFTKFGDYASPIEMIIPHSGVLTKFNGGRGGIATSPLKSTTSKASVKKWKPTARAACSNRRPSRGRMISSSLPPSFDQPGHPRRIRSDDGAHYGTWRRSFRKSHGGRKGKASRTVAPHASSPYWHRPADFGKGS